MIHDFNIYSDQNCDLSRENVLTVCRFEMDSHSYKASDNSRGKKVKFCGIVGDKFAEKTADFAGISWEFSGQISTKNKEKSQEERFQKKKKIYWKDVKFRTKKKTQKFNNSNTVLKAIVLVSSHKNLNISFTETSGRLTSFFSCNLEPNTVTE